MPLMWASICAKCLLSLSSSILLTTLSYFHFRDMETGPAWVAEYLFKPRPEPIASHHIIFQKLR